MTTIDLFSGPLEKEGIVLVPESTLLRIADSNQAIKKLLNTLRVRNDQFEAMNAVTGAACRIAVTESDLRRVKGAEEDQP